MKKILISLFCIVSSFTYAGTQAGTVTNIIVRQSDGLHYFYVSGTAVDRPACAAKQNYWMIKDEHSVAGKSQLSMLLTAYASGKTVKILGSGTCSRWGDGEDLNEIHLN